MGELPHYPPCCPGSNICLGIGALEAHIFELVKDNMLRLATKPLFIQCILLIFIHGFWDTLRQNAELARYPRESYPTIHAFPSYGARNVDSGVAHRWIVG